MLQNRPEKTTLLRVSALVLGFAALLTAQSAQAQTRSYNTPYLLGRGGVTVYGGELDQAGETSGRDATSWLTRNFGFLIGGELGYQFTPAFGFGLGANYAQYNVLSEVGSTPNPNGNGYLPGTASENLPSFTAIFRYTALPNAKLSPFVNFGAQAVIPGNSNGTERPIGGGPLFGAGLDLAFSPRLSLFLESNFGFIFPDDAVDGLNPGGASGGGLGGDDVEFDVLGHYGGGLKFNFRGIGVAAELQSLQCPAELTVGETGSFMAMTNADATMPVTTTWMFGDTSEGTGMSTTHAYSAPGTYTVSAMVNNGVGSGDTETCLVTVRERVVAAAISGCRATPASVDVNGAVTFNGTVTGTAPVTVSVDFGDGSATASSLPARHTYTAPGSYTARITVSNSAGTNSCQIPVTVGDTFCATITELNPVYYGFGASTLTAAARGELDENIEILRRCPSICVTINGYADDQETDVDRLSQRRADAVRDYYIAQGIPATRLRAVGRGQDPNANSKEDPGPGDSRARRADSIPSSCTGF
jgi:outer membrane protein OmpA-like peptidoglycan-associated protein